MGNLCFLLGIIQKKIAAEEEEGKEGILRTD